MRHVLIYQDEDGAWCAEVPSLPGCFSDGTTYEEAIENIKDAMQLFIESLEARGLPIPEDNYHHLVAVQV
jgi:predicted RNase H-like HicB family nuclease